MWPETKQMGVNRRIAARDARIREGMDTDDELYKKINKIPGASVYELAKEMKWSSGKAYGPVRRLEKIGWVRIDRTIKDGRPVLAVKSVSWIESLTPQEIEEFKNMEF